MCPKFSRIKFSLYQEDAVKREADSVLGEVRQKQNEGQRMLQLLEALGGLRCTRAVQAVAQGQPKDAEAEQRFTTTTGKEILHGWLAFLCPVLYKICLDI